MQEKKMYMWPSAWDRPSINMEGYRRKIGCRSGVIEKLRCLVKKIRYNDNASGCTRCNQVVAQRF